jgi:hypothetical protein
MLAKIWWNPFLVVPYPASPTYNVEVGLVVDRAPGATGSLPIVSRLFVDSVENGALKHGETRRFRFMTGTMHIVSVDQYVSGTEGTRYFSSDCSFSVSSARTYTFEYRTQYYVELVSPYGTPNGSSWYDVGSTALLSVQPTEVGMTGSLGTMGGKALLDHWTENSGLGEHVVCNDMSLGYCRIVVVSPMTVTAVWREDLSFPYLIGSLSGTLLLLTLILIVRWRVRRTRRPEADGSATRDSFESEGALHFRRRDAHVDDSSPCYETLTVMPIMATKFCRHCGAKIPHVSNYCEECGKSLA